MLLDERLHQRLILSPTDLAKVERSELGQGALDRGRIHFDRRGRAHPPRGLLRPPPCRWKLDVSSAVKSQHETTALHVAQLSIGLPPVPRITELPGEGTTALFRPGSNELIDELDVRRPHFTTSIPEDHCHTVDMHQVEIERKFNLSDDGFWSGRCRPA